MQSGPGGCVNTPGTVARTYLGGTDVSNSSKQRPKGLAGPGDSNHSPWGLSPSDFAFLWDDCPRCFYLKVARKQPRPRSPFPSVFGRIDRAMKDFYLGERAETVAPGMPRGVIGGGDRWVKSAPLLVPGSSRTFFIRGRVDVLVDRDDGTKGVLDFKTTVPKPDHIATYGRQLHAYAMALEHPSSGKPEGVSSLGLLCFSPDTYEFVEGRAGLYGDLRWIEVPRDDLGFAQFLGTVVSVLEHDDPPRPAPSCSWCAMSDRICAAA